jgi:DNA replication protein DnaC
MSDHQLKQHELLQQYLAEYQFDFPKKIQKQKVIRLFDCEFIEQHRSAVLVGPAGVGKTHLLTALGYTACGKRPTNPWPLGPAEVGHGGSPQAISGVGARA